MRQAYICSVLGGSPVMCRWSFVNFIKFLIAIILSIHQMFLVHELFMTQCPIHYNCSGHANNSNERNYNTQKSFWYNSHGDKHHERFTSRSDLFVLYLEHIQTQRRHRVAQLNVTKSTVDRNYTRVKNSNITQIDKATSGLATMYYQENWLHILYVH